MKLADARGQTFDAAALTRWGGYVLDPYAVVGLPGTEQSRWIVDPFAFMQQALALPDLPLPDTTTENGRRLMFIHIDGDGYPSRAELPGTPLAGEALLTQVLQRYRLPTTMSVIEGEVAPDGLYPALSAEMEAIARRTFALPYIETVSYTHLDVYKRQVYDDDVRVGLRNDDAVAHHEVECAMLHFLRHMQVLCVDCN